MGGTGNNLRVLIAPLDWGLGHATRCVPLIGELMQQGCEVVLAADTASARLLAREFPQLELKKLNGYNIKYGRKRLFWNLLLQLPRIFKTIRREHQWLKLLLQKERFDVIISDNRPGLWNKKSHCIYITHQLRIQSGLSSMADNWLQKLHSRYIKKFDSLWVPDLEGTENVAGELSHPDQQKLNPVYLGLLSRLYSKETVEEKYELMILLSGPEPQRTILEQTILKEAAAITSNILIVRGLPGNYETPAVAANVEVFNHLTASQLQTAIQQSKYIICRSGYTTLMDLLKLKKKALLIPTPGQTEQEYLASYMQQRGYFPFLKQPIFTLQKALETITQFQYKHPFNDTAFEHYETVIEKLIASKQNL
jgi:uncharacterized protein (TIGR00661 family)